jgi:hypothetical protein
MFVIDTGIEYHIHLGSSCGLFLLVVVDRVLTMPLLKKKPFSLAEPPKDLDPRELVYQVRFTKEIFRDYQYPLSIVLLAYCQDIEKLFKFFLHFLLLIFWLLMKADMRKYNNSILVILLSDF